MYGYFINISEKRGFWPIAGNTGVYDDGSSDVGVTTAYFGAYVTGASFNWILVPNRVNVEVAITNAALASTLAEYKPCQCGGGRTYRRSASNVVATRVFRLLWQFHESGYHQRTRKREQSARAIQATAHRNRFHLCLLVV
jgi:hypothetical protein